MKTTIMSTLLAVLLLAAMPAKGQESVTDIHSIMGPREMFKDWSILTVDKVVTTGGFHRALAHFIEDDAWGHSQQYSVVIGCSIHEEEFLKYGDKLVPISHYGCSKLLQLKAGASYRYRVSSDSIIREEHHVYPVSNSVAANIDIIITGPPLEVGYLAHQYYFVVRPGK